MVRFDVYLGRCITRDSNSDKLFYGNRDIVRCELVLTTYNISTMPIMSSGRETRFVITLQYYIAKILHLGQAKFDSLIPCMYS